MIDEYLAGAASCRGCPELDRAMHYALHGGKRVRARLCLAAARAGGADPSAALPAAAALELIQAFSLVHDDLPALDDDVERRGRPTAHVEFGEGVAVLIGDGLLNAAFGLVAERLEVPPSGGWRCCASWRRGSRAWWTASTWTSPRTRPTSTSWAGCTGSRPAR